MLLAGHHSALPGRLPTPARRANDTKRRRPLGRGRAAHTKRRRRETQTASGKNKTPCQRRRPLARGCESGRLDLNQRPPAPEAGALPGYATPRRSCHKLYPAGAPGRTRTSNLLIRSQMLYPIELRAPSANICGIPDGETRHENVPRQVAGKSRNLPRHNDFVKVAAPLPRSCPPRPAPHFLRCPTRPVLH